MSQLKQTLLTIHCLLIIVLLSTVNVSGQSNPAAPLNIEPDTVSFKKSNTDEWHNGDVRIHYTYLGSNKEHTPDSSIHSFHRRALAQPWQRDLGNQGGPSQSLLFTTRTTTGPTLGYFIYDAYRFTVDSLRFYNTNRPYSAFTFQLGSKLEQVASIHHTQNIKPNWNFSVEYRKIFSPGYYSIQRANHDNGNLTTHYRSIDRRYNLYAGVVYNKEQNDENGGILADSLLSDPAYGDRRTVPVAFANSGFGTSGTTVPRSSVSNTLRDYSAFIDHSYTFGSTDTTYNEDSTQYSLALTPRFSIRHRLQVSGYKHVFNDVRPDSLRYVGFFNQSFAGNGADSVYSEQKWSSIDNKLVLNGFLGKRERQLQFSTGLGLRSDKFSTNYLVGTETENIASIYAIGGLQKEALRSGEWFYNANATFFITGAASGNSLLQASIGKDLKDDWATIDIGASQLITNAPYSYGLYINQYDTINKQLSKESYTQLYLKLYSRKLNLLAGARNYIIANYAYLNATQRPYQYAPTFNIAQVWVQKIFRWRSIVLDNELVYQQPTSGAPINVPQLLGRHQLSVETKIFKNTLKVATGIQIRYHSGYAPSGYSPFFNRFYYQDTYSVSNAPETAVFFNFKIKKRFRAYVMGDQMQQLFTTNNLIAQGYAGQNAMIRFGFNWIMVN
ncbi:MAG: putative porin [Flavipsychrobacter sp.]